LRQVRRLTFAVALLAVAGPASAFTSTWDAASGILPSQMNCPWTLINNSVGPVLAGGILSIATTANSQNTYYQQTQAQLAMPSDSLVITWKTKVISNSTSSTSRAADAVEVEVSPFRGTVVFVGNGEIFFNNGPTTRGGTAAVPTTDAIHTYRLVIIGTALRVYDDGLLKLTGSTFVDSVNGSFAGFPRILWGEASSLSFGSEQWTFFQHNASPGTNCQTVPTRTSSWGRVKSIYR
jgi:hypothetical protein